MFVGFDGGWEHKSCGQKTESSAFLSFALIVSYNHLKKLQATAINAKG